MTLTLARNILIHCQLLEIAKTFKENNVGFIALKGAALVELFETYSYTREMEDIDLLVQPDKYPKAVNCLKELGYQQAKSDPASFINPSKKIQIDILNKLWYLDKTRNLELWKRSRSFRLKNIPGEAFHLPPADFFIHIFAHSCIHHATLSDKAKNDMELVKTLFKPEDNMILQKKLKEYGFYNVYLFYFDRGKIRKVQQYFLKAVFNSGMRDKGYLLRFIFLPARLKAGYLAELLFPSNEFLKSRYNLKTSLDIIVFRILRPFAVLFKLTRSLLSAKKFKNSCQHHSTQSIPR